MDDWRNTFKVERLLLIKKNGFFTDQLEDAQSIVDPEEWRIGKSLLRLHDHLLTKKDWWLMDQFKDTQPFASGVICLNFSESEQNT